MARRKPADPDTVDPVIRVRRIHRRDLNRVWDFLKKVFRSVNKETVEYQRPRTKTRFLEIYEEEGIEQLLFEVHQGALRQVVGYAECAYEVIGSDNWINERYFDNRDMRPLFVEEIAIHPGFQGRGIGSFVIEQLEHLARVHGCTHLVLEVAANNKRALQFYRARSFAQLDAAIFLAKKVISEPELLPPRALLPADGDDLVLDDPADEPVADVALPIELPTVDDEPIPEDMSEAPALEPPAGKRPRKRLASPVPEDKPGKRRAAPVPADKPAKRRAKPVPADKPGKRRDAPVPEDKPAKRRAADAPGAAPVTADKPAKRGRPAPEDKPAKRGRPVPEDKPAKRGRPAPEDKPAKRGQPAPADKPAKRGRPAPEDKPAKRGRPAPEDKPAKRGRPASKDKPAKRRSQPVPADKPALRTADKPARKPRG